MSAAADRPGAGGGERGLEVRRQWGHSQEGPPQASPQDIEVVSHEGFRVIKELKGSVPCLFYEIWKLQKRKSVTQRKFTGHIIGYILTVRVTMD